MSSPPVPPAEVPAPPDPPAPGRAPGGGGMNGTVAAPPRALLVDDRADPRRRAAAELRRALPHLDLAVAADRAGAVALLEADGPLAFAVLRDGMAWGEEMSLPHALRDRLPRVPLILTCDPTNAEAPADAQDPAAAVRLARRHDLEAVIPIAGDNVAAIAAAAEACLKLTRVRDDRDREAAGRRRAEGKVDSLLRAAAKLADAEAGDRRELARVLHEDMLQILVAARMFLACAADPNCAGAGADDAAPSPLGEVDALLVRSVRLCKDLTGLWSPLVLYEAGLVSALRWLGETTRPPAEGDEPSAAGSDGAEAAVGPIPPPLVAEVDCDDAAEPATQDGRALLYQAAVELLTNAARHSGADRARLTLRRVPGPGGATPGGATPGGASGDHLQLTVSDAGRGIPAAGESSAAGAAADAFPADGEDRDREDRDRRGERFGLFSLRERLRLAGGRMEIESAPGRGTTVRLLYPVEAGADRRPPAFADDPASPADPAPPADPHALMFTEAPPAAAPAAAPAPGPGATAAPIRVLLADDHRIIRLSLSGLLRGAGGVEVVGEAVDGEDALAKVAELQPDVVLMDVNMPRLDGVEATRRLKAQHPHVRVIALSMHETDDRERDMFDAGAERYVVKDGPPDQLLHAVLTPPAAAP